MTGLGVRAVCRSLTVVLALGALQLLGTSAQAVDTPTPGTAVTPLLQPLPGEQDIAGASPEFVLHTRAAFSELNPATTYTVVRVSDGTVVRTFEDDTGGASTLRPQLQGSSLVQLVEVDNTHRRVEVRDVATGALQRTIDTTGHALLHADPTWAMVNDVGVDTSHNTVRFISSDGSVTTVPQEFSQPVRWVGGDPDTVYVADRQADYAIDVASGVRTRLDFPDAARLTMVSPTHVIGTLGTGATRSFRSLERAGLAPDWQVDGVPYDYRDRGFFPYGDGLAQLYLPDGAPDSRHKSLRVVDMSTGALESPLVGDVFQAVPMTDGRIALTVADTPGGRLAVATGHNGTVAALRDLPDLGELVSDIGLVGGRVLASYGSRTGVWSLSPGPGGWSEAYADPGFASSSYKRLTVAGDVVMTANSEVSSSADRFRLLWPGGHRDFYATSARLGRGGEYVQRVDFRPRGGLVEVADVRNGVVVDSRSGYETRAIDGSRSWSNPDASALITGTDLAGLDPPLQAQLPSGCANGRTVDARGRWVAVTCGAQTRVVDVQGSLPTYTVSSARGWVLGGGFVATMTGSGGQSSPVVLRVTELATGDERTYGPLRGLTTPPGIAVAPDDDGSHSLAYIDPDYQVRRVSLDWMRPEAPPARLTGSPDVAQAVSSTEGHDTSLTWTYSGASSYDVRRGSRAATEWTLPAEWQGLDEPSVTATIEPGSGACFSARARNSAGEVTGWSPPVCQYVDGGAPVLSTSPQIPAAVASAVPHGSTLTWSYLDPSSGLPGAQSIESYDVRRGDRGGSSWTLPASWQGLTQPTVSDTIAPGDGACYSSRATDAAGNTSAWSEPVCQYVDGTVPRILTTSGSVAYPTALRAPVVHAVSASDAERVTSYDVERAVAPRGRTLGAWARVASGVPGARYVTGPQQPGSVICLRARARDEAGNVSGWSRARCTTASVDDSELVRRGRTALRAGGVVGGGYLSLSKKKSSATLSGQVGRTVGVWVRRAPTLGRADVFAGGRRIGRISFRSPTVTSGLVLLPVPGGFTGDVRVVNVGKKAVQVDGVLVVR